MVPTPTPIILSAPVNSGDIPLTVWLITALAIGSQVLLFYRRRRLAQRLREAKKRG